MQGIQIPILQQPTDLMKRLLIIMILGMSAFVASAQPEIYMQDGTVDPGDEICVPIRGRFFTDIVTIEFSVNFDAEQLEFISVGNFGLPGANNANFDLSQAANGIITFQWNDGRTCEDTNGGNPSFTIDNNEVLFEMCFRAREDAGYGDVTEINITDNPVPINVERLGSFNTTFGCNNLGFLDPDKDGVEPGLISISVRPVEVIISQEVGNAGDLVCVNFAVSGFDNLQSMQFNVYWDSTVMELANIVPNDEIPQNGLSNFGTSASSNGNIRGNRLSYNWFDLLSGDDGVTLEDGTQLFQACYRLLDDSCEKNTTVTIDDHIGNLPLNIEVTNVNVPGFKIFFESQDGSVQVNDCEPEGIQVMVDCPGPVDINDEVCIPVRAGDNYDRVSSLEFILKWNSNILAFKEVTNFNPGWTSSNFDPANAANGFLGVAWENSPGIPPQDLNPNTVIFEVCFDVVGLGGNSPVNVSTPWRGRSGNGPNIGVNPTNCELEVNQPEGVAISIGDGAAGPGDEFCVDFNVSGFQDITGLSFSLAYDPGLFQLANVQNIQIPTADVSNFNTSGSAAGSIFFQWESASPQNMADMATAFQICFTPLGDPGDCSPIEGVNIPVQPEANNAISGDENIGLTIASGELCTLFPDGFGLNIGESEVDWLDTACVSVSVVEFDNISAANFCITWDPSTLEYTGINILDAWTGLTEADVDASSANVGVLCIDWTGTGPLAIPDDTDVFELCFKALEYDEDCYEINMQESPAPAVTTSNGPGSIIPTEGQLCVNDKFYIVDTLITPASCPGACDGSVEITVIGGEGARGVVWFTEPNNQFNPTGAQNLCPGPITFRISDGNSPSLVEEFTIEIPLADGVPEANAGDDAVLGCDPPSVLLSGNGSEGDNFAYEWFRVNTNGQEILFADTRSAVELVTGTKIFRVTNTTTGCSASDTLIVTALPTPVADAGEDLEFTCEEGGLQLDGSGSDSGDNLTYTWISRNNGVIAAGQETLINPMIEAPGTYILRVAFEENGCFGADTVRVTDGRVEPDVVAGQDQILDCGVGTATLESLSNNPDLNVSYEWYDQNNQLIGTGESIQVDQLGNYVLLARDNASNCTSIDSVMVLPDANYPDVVIDPALPFTCVRDSVMLAATVGPDTIDYTFTWTVSGGGQLVPGSDTSLNPIALSPGTYTLAVTNTATSCTAEIDIVVGEDITPPTAAAGPDQLITCEDNTATLTGAGSDAGDGFAYLWTNMDGDTIATTLMAEVSAPGTYTLQVTNLENGCTATDQAAVTLDGNVPQVTISGDQDITCEVTAVNLSGSVTPAGPAYQYQWLQLVGGDAFNPIGDGTANLTVTQPGVYILEARNPADGCIGSNQVTIGINNEAPVADAGAATQTITCDDPTLTLDASASSQGEEFTYTWSDAGGVVGNGQTLEVTAPGIYTLTVSNSINACTATQMVEIVDGQQAPELLFSNPEPALDCINTSVELEGLVSGATDLSVSWIGLDGGTPMPSDALRTTVSQPGTYRLVVENNLTGCVDSLELTVVDNSANPPVVSIAEPIPFTCTTPTINLDAGATGNAGDFSSISWMSADGNTITPATGSLQVAVDGPGTYELTVVDANTGCSGSGTVLVVPDNNTPVAAAGADFGIECAETGILDALASSQGMQFTYEWVNLDGGAVPMPSDDLEASVDEPAGYLLIVTNTENGCVDTDTVQVSRIFPPDAAAGEDFSLCRDQTAANLSANQPAGTTGLWTSGGTAGLDAVDNANTGVSGLISGANVFTWTLSAPGCPNYSQDQVTVYIETAPIAVEDLLIVEGENRNVSIDVAANDVRTNVDAYSVTLLGAPEFGTIDSFNNGMVYYSVPRGFVGVTQVQYEICSLDCEDLCATGNLRINVSDDDYVPMIMNTITPNGDGMNDFLEFDVLLFTPPSEFPDNEIIIFNRWGDIVYQQEPYNNNWDGRNANGDRLPQGTYYYILRLNLADGVIIRGDVTILNDGER